MTTAIEIITFDSQYAQETVLMWRASKEAALQQKEMHSVADHQHFLTHILTQNYCVYLAQEAVRERVVAILACSETEVSQLYLHVNCQRQGLGRRLLNLAKQKSAGTLQLRTFEVNSAAQQFYLSQGFTEMSRGSVDNEEQLPDILYRWSSQ